MTTTSQTIKKTLLTALTTAAIATTAFLAAWHTVPDHTLDGHAKGI